MWYLCLSLFSSEISPVATYPIFSPVICCNFWKFNCFICFNFLNFIFSFLSSYTYQMTCHCNMKGKQAVSKFIWNEKDKGILQWNRHLISD